MKSGNDCLDLRTLVVFGDFNTLWMDVGTGKRKPEALFCQASGWMFFEYLRYLNSPNNMASILSVMFLNASVSDSNFWVSPSTMIRLPL